MSGFCNKSDMKIFSKINIKKIATALRGVAGFLFGLVVLSSSSAWAMKFTVTGYYSPLPKQEFYLTGDYDSEIRLNGKGLYGADGTEVYHGMIAAPRNYKFGTNICLEKLGCGTVHDRGGAIVNKGERNTARHDRIDYWMGHGTDGLIRSLNWGVQHVNGSFAHGTARKRSLVERRRELSPIVLEIIRQKIPTAERGTARNLFTKNLYPGANRPEVRKLKEALSFLKFFRGNLESSKYDDQVRKAVLNFQLKYGVVDSENARGAGNFGPKSREKMEKVLRQEVNKYFRQRWTTNVFRENLGFDDHDMDVFRLQQLLIDKGYLDATPTGYFGPKTEKALEKFQLDYGIIKSKNARGAGNFGPKSREKMKELWLARRDDFFPPEKQEAPLIMVKDEGRMEATAGVLLDFTPEIKKEPVQFTSEEKLFRGKRNAEVRKLQKVLKKLGFFAGNPTGFFGDKTAEALLAFQIKHGIVQNRRSIGASIFGPSTRAKMNEVLRNL